MLCVYRPVNMVVREGVHCGEAAYARMKLAPPEARARRLGISTCFEMGLVGSSTLPSIESDMRKRMLYFVESDGGEPEDEPVTTAEIEMTAATAKSRAFAIGMRGLRLRVAIYEHGLWDRDLRVG